MPEPKDLPSLRWPIAVIVIALIAFIFNAADVIGGGPIALGAGFVPVNLATMWWGWRLWNNAIEQRQQIRQAQNIKWLREAEVEIPPEIDWAEIERAMDELLKQDVEPTYERAKGYLRREKDIAELAQAPPVVDIGNHMASEDDEFVEVIGPGFQIRKIRVRAKR